MAIKQLVGPSGSGLTHRLTALYESTVGAVMLTDDARSHITYLRPTVEEELAFGLEQRGVAVTEMRQRIEVIAQGLNLSDLLDRAPNQLSGGQTRRLALGTVLILDAPLVLLDSPFAGLDPASHKAVIAYLHTLEADIVVAGHQAWMTGVDTEYLGEHSEFNLPAPVAPVGNYHKFEEVTGHNGMSKRRWWQFRKPSTPLFTVGPVSFAAPGGGVLWLRGGNGSGKTTLMKALVEHHEHVGLMLQDPVDQIIDPTVEQMVPDASLRDAFNLDGDEHPLDLSQRQLRLAQFASVIGADLDVLCADEPDVGLDITGREELHRGFARILQCGTSIILTCHDESFVEEVRSYAQVDTLDLSLVGKS